MKYDDEFVPENVDEQIDHVTYSPHLESPSSKTRVIRELHAYYKEDQLSTERMWERLTPYVASYESPQSLISDQPEAKNEIFAEKMLPKKSERNSSRKKFAPQLALIAAIFCTSLVVGSLLFVFQMVHSTRTGSHPAALSHGLYISKKGEVSRLDPLTRKTIWRTVVPKSGIATGSLVVLDDTVYLNLSGQFYALNTSDGHIRWSDKNFSAFPLDVVDGLLYARAVDFKHLYVLNPTDGKIKAIYTPADGKSWNTPTVANGILYYGTGADLYAITPTNHHIIWHQRPISLSTNEESIVEDIQVKNGIAYTRVLLMNTPTGPHYLIVAFDARTGEKLWGPKTDAHILAISDTTVYTTAINLTPSAQLDALDAHTGTLLWHQTINPSKIQTASDWHSIINMQVDPDMLYVSYDSRSSAGGVVALKVSDGTLLWQAKVDNQEAFSPQAIQDRTVYTISNDGKNGMIDAFNASNGSLLWHMAIKGGANEWEAVIA